MKIILVKIIFLGFWSFMPFFNVFAQTATSGIPHLHQNGNTRQLIVNGKPLLRL